MTRIAILTVDSMAGHIATTSLIRELGDQVVAVSVFDEIRQGGMRKVRSLLKFLREKSASFLVYRVFVSSSLRVTV